MSGISIQMEGNNYNSLEGIVRDLKEELNAELICETYRYIDTVSICVLSFEKFFMRNGSYASLSIVLTDKDGEKTADIIGSGGGEGLFNISWGANSDFAEKAERVLMGYGLETVSKY